MTMFMPPYSAFTQYTPTLPQFYWDVYSAEQRIKHICFEIDKIINYADSLGVQLNITHDDVEELQQEFEQFKESGFADYYEQLLQKWIDENHKAIYEHLAKQVFFGLTDDGMFCAYVPDSWSDITFDTGANYGAYDYGRLILRFDADGTGVIDNTRLTTVDNYNALSLKVDSNTKRTDSTFDTLFTNLDKNAAAPHGNEQHTPITLEKGW